jgi:hypothetical protein
MSSQNETPRDPLISLPMMVVCALLYAVLFFANDWLTQYLVAAPGVNWIYLPAGLRLFLVLIFGFSGALGIAISSIFITLHRGLGDSFLSIIGIGLISGFSPLLARYLTIRNLQISTDLSNLTFPIIFSCILIFALSSSGLHQLWFWFMNIPSGSFPNAIVMFIGDILGSILLIALVKICIDLYKQIFKRQTLL